jgi:hypothetical protein
MQPMAGSKSRNSHLGRDPAYNHTIGGNGKRIRLQITLKSVQELLRPVAAATRRIVVDAIRILRIANVDPETTVLVCDKAHHRGHVQVTMADYMIGLQAADQEKGRFRSFLRTMFKRFLSKERERDKALKRGGNQTIRSFDVNAAESR